MEKSKKGKPGLAIIIGQALAKKGKAKHDPMGDGSYPTEHDDSAYSSPEEADAHLQEIADDMMKAIQDGDSKALKELLREAFECLEMSPHDEVPHESMMGDQGESEGNPY